MQLAALFSDGENSTGRAGLSPLSRKTDTWLKRSRRTTTRGREGRPQTPQACRCIRYFLNLFTNCCFKYFWMQASAAAQKCIRRTSYPTSSVTLWKFLSSFHCYRFLSDMNWDCCTWCLLACDNFEASYRYCGIWYFSYTNAHIQRRICF